MLREEESILYCGFQQLLINKTNLLLFSVEKMFLEVQLMTQITWSADQNVSCNKGLQERQMNTGCFRKYKFYLQLPVAVANAAIFADGHDFTEHMGMVQFWNNAIFQDSSNKN